ncbi:MAG: hypothetical protein ACREM1_00570, partial [Longimicrobiales bacterium]
MALGGWTATDHLISADPTPRFEDDWTGTDNDPWNALKWQDDSVGSGLADIQSNRGRLVTTANTVETDPVRMVALMDPLGDQRIEVNVEIPNEACRLSLYLRGDGVWDAAVTLQHLENGYQFFIQRSGAGAQPTYQLWRHSSTNGDASLTGALAPFGTTGTTEVRIRFQAVGSRLAAEVVDGFANPFTDDWTLNVADSLGPTSGIVAMTNGGNTGVNPTIFVDDLQVFHRTALARGNPYLRSFWVYIPGTATGGGGGNPLSDDDDAQSDEARHSFINPDNGNNVISSRDNSVTVNAIFNPTPEDQWVHVSHAYVSGVLREIRVNNGAEVTNTTSSNPDDALVSRAGYGSGATAVALHSAIGMAS